MCILMNYLPMKMVYNWEENFLGKIIIMALKLCVLFKVTFESFVVLMIVCPSSFYVLSQNMS